MTASPKGGCPICGGKPDPEFRPFCSKRCADIDLGRWFNERYVVPDERDNDESAEISEEAGED